MRDVESLAPESTAVRVALWRALHVQVDAPPHVLDDEIGLQLVAPEANWHERRDMDLQFTRPFRASIVARARFIEDLVTEEAARGIRQYVILGAGLDTFAQRRTEIASQLTVLEVDQPGPQRWKQRRLCEEGYDIPDWLRFAPVDFEAGDSWWNALLAAGFNANEPAVIASTGVSMYLSRDAIDAMLRQIATFATGSTLAMTFVLPVELAEPEERPGYEAAVAGARASGTPFISFFTPQQITELAKEAGFKEARTIPPETLTQRYFSNRTDGLRLAGTSEHFLIAKT